MLKNNNNLYNTEYNDNNIYNTHDNDNNIHDKDNDNNNNLNNDNNKLKTNHKYTTRRTHHSHNSSNCYTGGPSCDITPATGEASPNQLNGGLNTSLAS